MSQTTAQTSVLWTGFDVLLIFALWVMLIFIAKAIVVFACHDQLYEGKIYVGKEAETVKSHPIVQMVQEGKHQPMVLLVAFLTAVVAAPLLEEFLFRLLLQGWLEAALFRFGVPQASGIAIVTVSLCFAAVHIDNQSSFLTHQVLFYLMTASVAINLLVFTMGMIYLVRKRNIKKTDILGTDRFFCPRFSVYVGYWFLILLCLYGLTAVLEICFPGTNVSPIPLFFFSLLLGFLYCRTRNLSYCILLHAVLNGISLLNVWCTGSVLL